MPDSPTRATAPPTVARSALRVVLFGMPDAGKSSLLGALAQAAQTQEHVLNGHLTDVGRGLAGIQRRLYEESPRGTPEEVLPFPIVFEPFARRQDGKMNGVIIDCDGRVANDLLARRRELDSRGGGELGRAILAADAVLFVVDVSASSHQIDVDFTECARFLRLFEHRRGQRADVGGLPIFLVFTKCDLLAQSGDDLAAWVEKIEERKREIGRRFRTFLDQGEKGGALAFGSIHLNVWATAVKRPELSDQRARPREPYGVAELFRQCFALAREYRKRRGRSSLLLVATLLAVLVAVSVLAALPGYLVWNRPTEQLNDLEARVSQFRDREEALPPAARHRQTQEQVDRLYDFRTDKAFAELPDPLKEYVDDRLRELQAYESFARKVDALPDPRELRNEPELKGARASALPLEKTFDDHADWRSTDAGRRLATTLEQLEALEKAVQGVVAGYEKVIREGQQVLKESEKPNLPTRALQVLQAARELPDPKMDAKRPLPGSDRLTYGAVFGFDPVRDALREWAKVRKELEGPASLKTPPEPPKPTK